MAGSRVRPEDVTASPAPRSRLAAEDGAATVFAAFALLALLAMVALCVQVGGALVVKHRVQSAADLAALAAAGALADGGDACAMATDYASRNGARMASCAVEGQGVLVRARMTLPLSGVPGSGVLGAGVLGPDSAVAAARAQWRTAG